MQGHRGSVNDFSVLSGKIVFSGNGHSWANVISDYARINNTIDFYSFSRDDKTLVRGETIKFQSGESTESIALNNLHFYLLIRSHLRGTWLNKPIKCGLAFSVQQLLLE